MRSTLACDVPLKATKRVSLQKVRVEHRLPCRLPTAERIFDENCELQLMASSEALRLNSHSTEEIYALCAPSINTQIVETTQLHATKLAGKARL